MLTGHVAYSGCHPKAAQNPRAGFLAPTPHQATSQRGLWWSRGAPRMSQGLTSLDGETLGHPWTHVLMSDTGLDKELEEGD